MKRYGGWWCLLSESQLVWYVLLWHLSYLASKSNILQVKMQHHFLLFSFRWASLWISLYVSSPISNLLWLVTVSFNVPSQMFECETAVFDSTLVYRDPQKFKDHELKITLIYRYFPGPWGCAESKTSLPETLISKLASMLLACAFALQSVHLPRFPLRLKTVVFAQWMATCDQDTISCIVLMGFTPQ